MAKAPQGTDADTKVTRLAQPIILIRGFGGLGVEDEKRIAYQGFNDGTVYPHKRGENYIYEGLILRFLKSRWTYNDATNIVGYYGSPIDLKPSDIPDELKHLDKRGFFSRDKVIIDPAMALQLVQKEAERPVDPLKTLWVFRYYDLNDRSFPVCGQALVRVIDFIRELAAIKNGGEMPKVNIIAHSMGGLIVREAVQSTYPAEKRDAAAHINKIVTLGTPHQGISFQLLKNWIAIDAAKELEQFNPDHQKDKKKRTSFFNFSKCFPPERMLTVVGTNYRTYGPVVASGLNRIFSVSDEFGPTYNRSDGLVKQTYAQMPDSPRTFVHKCHGGPDSLVTSREAFEIATRFLFGDIKVNLNLVSAEVRRGHDLFGKSEFFFGVSIKPRKVDFDLFHQSAEAENCYGPFKETDLSDPKPSFAWAGKDRLIWEGWLDTAARRPDAEDIVMRLDVYVGERDAFGVGFSDNLVFRKQYYVRALFSDFKNLTLQKIELHADERFNAGEDMRETREGWLFKVGNAGFAAEMRLSFTKVPDFG